MSACWAFTPSDVSTARLRQFFVKEDQHYRVRKDIREKVLFVRHNLLSDLPFSQLDLVVCLNLLIYLDGEVQREILRLFHFALRKGGCRFLGSSELAYVAADHVRFDRHVNKPEGYFNLIAAISA